ncbi:MAG TPA: tRNA-dihydrouridine synthase [Nitratifractor sp.]|nr:tRNA-dihydrouridine synthase [Nitratifractor sp.]HHD74551.1 tRNA-dihydrouridine synthase [Nitratifractor sp.]HHH20352.1 tRNA-dihydrouridine synthase [Nitratifractor sp.]
MSLDFSKPLYFLAPLAGLTDLPFRSVVKKYSADVTVSEMISSNALAFESKKTFKMLEKSPLESPYSIQIAGSDPVIIRRALEHINEREDIDVVDLNCGCPVPKVVNNLQGSSLLTDLKKMAEAIETIKKYSNKEQTSVKIRLGFHEKNHLEIAKVCQESGADFIAVHGRTRSGRFKAAVDYDAIAEIKEHLKIPVIANGDIDSAEKAQWVLEYTKCDGIMVGRAAVGRPWIFQEMKDGREITSKDLVREVVLEHFDEMIKFYGDYGAILFRKHLHNYSKYGYSNATGFRDSINRVNEPMQMREIIENFF